MSRFDFVFSNRMICRVSRHTAFWLLFSSYILIFRYYLYDLKYLFLASTYQIRLHNLLMFLPLSILFAYLSLYVLMPVFILKSKYKQLIFIILLLSIASVSISYLISTHYDILLAWDIPLMRSSLIRQLDFTFSNGLVYPLTVSVFAISIKMAKRLYSQQKDNERLIQLKMQAELLLLKSQIHPRFLFHSLNSIYRDITEGSANQAPTTVLQLSDLLSYILYESEEEWVPLEKELEMIQGYIAIETVSAGKNFTTIYFQQTITDSGKFIAPLLLLPLIEFVFELDCLPKNKTTISLKTALKEDDFTFSVTVHKPDADCLVSCQKNNSLLPIHKRLEGHYPNKHVLKTIFEEEKLVILLRLTLDTGVQTTRID